MARYQLIEAAPAMDEDPQRRITRTTTRRDPATGEYHVRAYDQRGRRWPEGDYFTDDADDARATAWLMTQTDRDSEAEAIIFAAGLTT